MKKETISPGNIVTGENRKLKISELFEESVNCSGYKFSYDVLDGILLSEDWLIKEGYSHRVMSGQETYDDWIKQTDDENFYTITVQKESGTVWTLKIDNKDFVNVLTAKVQYIHTLQNLISNIIYV